MPRLRSLLLLLPLLLPPPPALARTDDTGFSPSETQLRSPRVEIPLHLTDSGLLAFRATVNGLPTRCVLDTGSAAPLVSPALIESAKLGLYRLSRMQMQDAGGNRQSERVAWMNTCSLSPDLTLLRLDAVEADLHRLMHGTATHHNHPVDLVLSISAFKDLLLTIDYPNRRLILQHGTLAPPDDDHGDILPLTRDRAGRLYVPATVGAHPLSLLLDTGCTAGLVLPASFLPPADAGQPLATSLSQFYYGTGTLDVRRAAQDLHLGRHTISKPLYVSRAATTAPAPPTATAASAAAPANAPAVLGAGYLQHFAVTLDIQHRRLRLTRPTTNPIDSPDLPAVPFHFTRDTGTVTSVRHGSAAQRAGVRVGDRILSVEDIPLPDLLAGHTPHSLTHPGHLTFQLEHEDHTRYTATLPLTDLTPTDPPPTE